MKSTQRVLMIAFAVPIILSLLMVALFETDVLPCGLLAGQGEGQAEFLTRRNHGAGYHYGHTRSAQDVSVEVYHHASHHTACAHALGAVALVTVRCAYGG